MTVVVLGIDALDPELVDDDAHPNLVLEARSAIDTIESAAGNPSTHELWPTIITGVPPTEHGLVLDDGVSWGSPLLDLGSRVADWFLPDALQRRLGAWLLTNTRADAFRTSATYYEDHGLDTVFDGRQSTAIGVPNYVVDPTDQDREHLLRRGMGELFERDADAVGGHRTSDPVVFYEQCMEMAMVRIARVRRALRSRSYELAFGYTSALDLVGHVSHSMPDMQRRAYEEADDFVADVVGDLGRTDELLLVSDHGLQSGVHTDQAMVSCTEPEVVRRIESVVDVRGGIDYLLDQQDHSPEPRTFEREDAPGRDDRVREQLQDLGYI